MRNRKGVEVVEVLVVFAIIGILMALLIPAVKAARTAARRSNAIQKEEQNQQWKEHPAFIAGLEEGRKQSSDTEGLESDHLLPIHRVHRTVEDMEIGEEGWIYDTSLDILPDRTIWIDFDTTILPKVPSYHRMVRVTRRVDGYVISLSRLDPNKRFRLRGAIGDISEVAFQVVHIENEDKINLDEEIMVGGE